MDFGCDFMQRRQIIMNLRTSGHLKGVKPCMVFLKNNLGKIYNEGQADFVMSIKDDKLFFQKITFLFKKLKPKDDFELNLNNIVEYTLIERSLYNVLCLYDNKKRYIEINYHKGIADTFPTEDNICRIIKSLEGRGIKKINLEKDVLNNEQSDSATEKSNKEI